ncbi:MAG: diacylglycerol kinase family protein [Myxococcota bacterium]|nr:diacylglycerol kinase family protein [Myxococcota bacterium]
MQIGVINNLRAGRSGTQVSRILDLLRSHPDVHHVETGCAGALPEAIDHLAGHEIDLLVVNGGDGTIQHALTEILVERPFEKVPMVAPLPGGRTNTTAMDVGSNRSPVKGLAALLRDAKAGHLEHRRVDRPVLRVDFDGRRRTQYGMFFGVGMIHRAITLVHDIFPKGRSQGSLGAGIVTMGLIGKAAFRGSDNVLRPDKIQVLLDGELLRDGEFHIAMSTTLRRLFWRIQPFWGSGPGGVRFTSIASDAQGFGLAAPGILVGRPASHVRAENGYTSRNVECAELRLGCGFTIDGEIYPQSREDAVTVTPDRRVRFVRA